MKDERQRLINEQGLMNKLHITLNWFLIRSPFFLFFSAILVIFFFFYIFVIIKSDRREQMKFLLGVIFRISGC